MQISTINSQSHHYPDLLREISSPPSPLFIKGKLPTDVATVAIVGSRKPTEYGLQVTYQLAYELARAGVVIVSGLAFGIDKIAHEAALEAGGITIAVLPGGLDQVYPRAHHSLANLILERGALVSEYPVSSEAFKQNFIARNRIIAGLSLAVVVTEAAAGSGALFTANFALESNRQVLAVPGNITSPLSAGTNNLIKSGAVPVTSSSDVLAAINAEIVESVAAQPANQAEATILELLQAGHTNSQELIERGGFSASEFANTISLMEITGKVRNLGAGNWVAR